jgi:hypothetical protein
MKDEYSKQVQADLLISLCEDVMLIKTEVQNITKNFKRKSQMIKEEKLNFNKIETKSSNLKTLADDLITCLFSLQSLSDSFHSSLAKSKSIFILKDLDHMGRIKSSRLVLQVGRRDLTLEFSQ